MFQTILLEAILIISMVMVAEGGRRGGCSGGRVFCAHLWEME